MNTFAALIGFVVYVLKLLIWLIIIQVILSWLVQFNVINYSNRFVRAILNGIDAILDPLLRPIRRALPDLGGIDLSPMLLVLVIILAQRLLTGVALDMGA